MTDIAMVGGRHYLNGYCLLVDRTASARNRAGLGVAKVTHQELRDIVEGDAAVAQRIGAEIEAAKVAA